MGILCLHARGTPCVNCLICVAVVIEIEVEALHVNICTLSVMRSTQKVTNAHAAAHLRHPLHRLAIIALLNIVIGIQRNTSGNAQ